MSQSRLVSASFRLEDSQKKIELQLQQVLQAQTHRGGRLTSESLDASSPEGRQTWMELGRLLREEGIPSTRMSANKTLLIQTMKRALEKRIPSSGTASFRTACEYQSALAGDSSPHLLSSTPPLGGSFLDPLLEWDRHATDLLDQESNVQEGIESFIEGMERLG